MNLLRRINGTVYCVFTVKDHGGGQAGSGRSEQQPGEKTVPGPQLQVTHSLKLLGK